MKKLSVLVVAMAVLGLLVPAQSADAQEKIRVKDGCGEILKVIGNTVAVRVDETNKIRVFRDVSPDIVFIFEDGEGSVYDLQEGMHACAYHYETVAPPALVYIEEHEVATVADTPDPHDKPAMAKPAPAPKPAPMPAALPHTASSLPAAGLLGLLLVGLSLGIAALRRF